MRLPFLACALIVALSTVGGAQTAGGQTTPAANAKEEEGIRKVLADFTGAWNSHDAKAFSMDFAEDADFTNVRGVSAQGRTEIEKFHAPRFATIFKDTHLTITDIKIRFIKPDVAEVDARWEMTGSKTPDGKEVPLRKGLLDFVMTGEGGAWSITVMHNTDLTPQS
jgi:uncharacterized protein (TIGR02246 family)